MTRSLGVVMLAAVAAACGSVTDRPAASATLARGLDEAGKRGWTVVDMRQAWRVVYPFQK